MAKNQNLPIEVGFERAKADIVIAIKKIGDKHSLPSSLMLILLESVVTESKLNTFATIVSNCDIIPPTADNSHDQVMQSEETEDGTTNKSIE